MHAHSFFRLIFIQKNTSVSRKDVLFKLSSLLSVLLKREEWVIYYLKDEGGIGRLDY